MTMRNEMINKYKTLSKRFWANVLDGLIFLPFGFFDEWILSEEFWLPVQLSWLVISYQLGWLYSVLMHFYRGQTIGKMATGIKVLDLTESQITLKQAFLREVVVIVICAVALPVELYLTLSGVGRDARVFDSFFTVFGLLVLGWFLAEIISCLTNEKRRAIHDYIAGTVVVRKDSI